LHSLHRGCSVTGRNQTAPEGLPSGAFLLRPFFALVTCLLDGLYFWDTLGKKARKMILLLHRSVKDPTWVDDAAI